MMQTTNTVLMVRPVNFTFNEQTAANNSFQRTGFTGRAQEKALEEFDNYVRMLREAGIRVIVAEDTPAPHTPDSIFPNNWFSTHAPEEDSDPENEDPTQKEAPERTVGTETAKKTAGDPVGKTLGTLVADAPQPCGTLVLYPMFAPNRREERYKNVLTTLGFDKAEIFGSSRQKQKFPESAEENRQDTGPISCEKGTAEDNPPIVSRTAASEGENSQEIVSMSACKEENTEKITRTFTGKNGNVQGVFRTVSRRIHHSEKGENGNRLIPYRLLDLSGFEREEKFLEGTGSMILDRENKIAYCCASPRTNEAALDEFARLSGYNYFLFGARDEYGDPIYHTNVMMSVGTRYAIVCLDAVCDLDERERLIELLEENGKEILEIGFGQMNRFAGNMLELHDDRGNPVLAMSAAAYRSLEAEQLERLRNYYKIVAPPLEYIEKNGGGSARCMLAEIF